MPNKSNKKARRKYRQKITKARGRRRDILTPLLLIESAFEKVVNFAEKIMHEIANLLQM